MTDSILEASLTIEYCALQIAKLIERSKIEQFNSQLQFSPSEITNILNALPSGMNMDFHVNASAIHQGIHHLKKSLTRREFSCVEMFPYDDRIPKFFELEENLKKGYHLKFPIVIVGDENRSIDDLSADIASTRDDMFKLHRYKQSKYLKGFYIYNEFLKGPIKDCDDYKTPAVVKYKTRKSFETVSEKTKKNNAKRILEKLDVMVGEENVTLYLEFASNLNKKCQKSNKNNDDKNCNNNNNDDNNDDDNIDDDYGKLNDAELFSKTSMIANETNVKEAIKKIGNKYNTTTVEEKIQILNLFDAAKSACNSILSDEQICENEIISMTHELLQETGLSNINKRAISRLINKRGKILKRRGRKINQQFESELWANLMIWSFEPNDNDVSD